jgi:hypothetical protein
MIYEEICTYEVCKLAEERGFNGLCYAGYDRKGELLLPNNIPNLNMRLLLTDCIAPTQSLLQRWLREERGIQIYIDSDLDFDDETFVYEWQIANKENFDNGGFEIHRYNSEEPHSTYELALEDALKYALEKLV